MNKYKRYERYKDSGIGWIGEIPEEWNIKKLKWLCSISTGNKDTINKVDDGEYPFFVRSPIVERISTYSYDGEAVLTAGDGVGVGKVFHYINGKFDYHQRVYKFSDFKNVSGKYFYYYIKENFIKETEVNNAKSTVDSIRLPMIKQFPVTIPSKEEQTKVVDFLDKKTTETDGLIADKEKLIELLQEKRQAIISEAVTKGINPNARMKDSGIEWIGEIPEHWEVSKIKFTTYVKGRIGWQGLRADEFIDEGPYLVTGTDFVDGLVNWDSCYHISMERYNEAPPIQLRENDLLITKDGTIGKVAIVKNKPKYAILNSGIFVTRPKNSAYLTEFMYWILNSQVFNKFIQYMSLGSTIVHLYQQTFENFSFPITNLNEQKTIAHFLDRKVAEIDGLISDIKLQIQKLKEYRQSLISEAVTGKIDVREFQKKNEVIFRNE